MTDQEFRVDLHVKVLDEHVIDRAKARGLDALVYAPHFVRLPAIINRAEHFTDDDLLVVPGREIFTGSWVSRKHVLAVGLSKPIPDFITLSGAMAELDRQDAGVLVPHPEFATVSLEAEDIARYSAQLDGIEIYNPKHWPSHNNRALDIATKCDLPTFGSSYAHLRGSVGEVWTTFEEAFKTRDDLVNALVAGVPRTVDHKDGAIHRARCVAEFAHLFWENSVSKVYLLSKGVKPTNPHHPAYEGRFDDVAVYDKPRIRSFQ